MIMKMQQPSPNSDNQSSPTPSHVLSKDNPWPGPLTYIEQWEDFFFGRSAETNELLERVVQGPVTILYGKSGTGKSSLLQAGLYPRLREANYVPINFPLKVQTRIEQQESVIEQLRVDFFAQLDALGVTEPNYRPKYSGRGLWAYLHTKDLEFWSTKNFPLTPVFVLDQFEEIFTLGRRFPLEIRRLVIDLADLLENRVPSEFARGTQSRLHVVPGSGQLVEAGAGARTAAAYDLRSMRYKVLIALREDFLPDFEGLRRLMPSISRNRMRLLPMTRRQAVNAVLNDKTKHIITPSLGRKIVRHLSGFQSRRTAGRPDDQLPANVLAPHFASEHKATTVEPALLSIFCNRLIKKWQAEPAEGAHPSNRTQVLMRAFETGREQILLEYYEDTLKAFAPAVRRFVEECLITAQGFRQPFPASEATQNWGVSQSDIDTLVNQALLRRDGDRVELTHDRLAEPVRDSRDARKAQEALVKQRANRRKQVLLLSLFLVIPILGAATYQLFKLYRAANAALTVESSLRRDADLAKREAVKALQDAVTARSEADKARDATAAAAAESMRLATSRVLAASALSTLATDPERSLTLAVSAGLVTYVKDKTVSIEAEEALHRASRGWRQARVVTAGRGPVWRALFSPDGAHMAVSVDNSVKVWVADSGRSLPISIRHDKQVYGIAFSPDSKRLATASEDGTAKIWNIANDEGKTPMVLAGHRGPVRSVSFSHDGKRLATAGADRTAKIWDADSGRELLTLSDHTGEVFAVTFNPDGKRLATGSSDGTARIWDVTSGKTLWTLKGHAKSVKAVVFSADGRRLASGSEDLTAKLWDTFSGELRLTFRGHRGDASRFSGLDRSAQSAVNESITDVAFTPDAKWLATAGSDRTVKIWDTESGQQIVNLTGYGAPVYSVSFSIDGRQLATGTNDVVRIWEIGASDDAIKLVGHKGDVLRVAFSPDGARLVTTSEDATAKVWNFAAGREEFTLRGHTAPVIRAVFSPDGTRIVTGSEDNTARVWDAQSGRELHRITAHTGAVFNVAFSPDGTRLATASMDHSVKLWDTTKYKAIATLKGHRDAVYGLAFSPDGKQLATSSADKTGKLWDLASNRSLKDYKGHADDVIEIVFSPDGKQLATAGADQVAKMWDTASGREIFAISGHTGEVLQVAFSPDGKRLATASSDRTARIWDAASGRELFTSSGPSPVFGVAFNYPDGRHLAVASGDNIARVYSVGIDELIARARRQLTHAWDSPECLKYFQAKECPAIAQAVNSLARANRLAREGKLEQAVIDYTRALDVEPNLGFVPTAEAGLSLATRLIADGRYFARSGDIKNATEAFQKARDLNPTLRLDSRTEAGRLAAARYVEDARSLARAGEVDTAIQTFQKARQLDPALNLDPKAEAEKLAAPHYREEGRSLARLGAVDKAREYFEKARQLDPASVFDPQAELVKLAVPYFIQEGRTLARVGKIDDAIQTFQKALQLPSPGRVDAPAATIPGSGWNSLCWFGTLWGQASAVMDACEKAVAADPKNGSFRDSRGLALAFTGNPGPAIEDFQAYIKSTANPERARQRERWVEMLKTEQKLSLPPEEIKMLFSQ